jgi:hypothetical protein
MVTPNQKRVAVAHLVAEFVVSERRACLGVNQHRSTQRHCTTRSEEEQALRTRIRALAVKYPRYGYRPIYVMLLRDGYIVNRKRVQRLWHAEASTNRNTCTCLGQELTGRETPRALVSMSRPASIALAVDMAEP